MTKTSSIQTLLDLSKMRLDEATRALGALISSEKISSEQLNLLLGYRAEYYARFMAAAQSGMDRDSWRNYRTFLDRLDVSIAHAEEAVKQSRQRTTVGQHEWLGKKGRVRAFDTLAQRQQEREQYASQRIEQKVQDEFAARKSPDKAED